MWGLCHAESSVGVSFCRKKEHCSISVVPQWYFLLAHGTSSHWTSPFSVLASLVSIKQGNTFHLIYADLRWVSKTRPRARNDWSKGPIKAKVGYVKWEKEQSMRASFFIVFGTKKHHVTTSHQVMGTVVQISSFHPSQRPELLLVLTFSHRHKYELCPVIPHQSKVVRPRSCVSVCVSL